MGADNLPLDSQQQAPDGPSDPGELRAWEEIEPGRYMPRRVRGSFRGNKLG